MALVGPNSFMPLAARNFVQSQIAQTAPEAEVVSLEMAMKTVGIPALGIWDHILGPGAGLDCRDAFRRTKYQRRTRG